VTARVSERLRSSAFLLSLPLHFRTSFRRAMASNVSALVEICARGPVPNPDVSGIGVRVSYYVQTVLLGKQLDLLSRDQS
jgi:hypothetical protein